MSYERKWWSGHELYGIRPQEYRFRQDFDRDVPYFDLARDDEAIQLSYWKSLYPDKIKKVQNRVEEACEALEYDHSPMYDEYPDRIFLQRTSGEICRKLMQEDGFVPKEQEDPVLNTAISGMRPPQPPMNPWLRNIVDVLLYQEMHRRRSRRGRRRKQWF